MLDVYMPMMKSSALIAAGRLGLFEALADGPLPVAQLAARIESSVRGTTALADFLLALGFLEKHGESLANTASTQRWFTSRGQVDFTPGVLWTQDAWQIMSGLTDVVRNGAPEKLLWNTMEENPLLGERFAAYMGAFAMDLGPDLIAHVPISTQYRRLLDLGGSHGQHAIRFCRRYPQLDAVIMDLPSALRDTAATVSQAKLSDRIRLNPGNFLEQDWGVGHDVVFYLSVAHCQSAQDNGNIIRRIGESLNQGGLLVIHEYLTEVPVSAYHAAFRLTLLTETGTSTYAYEDYRRWLVEAGFDSVSRIDLNPLEKGSLILARR